MLGAAVLTGGLLAGGLVGADPPGASPAAGQAAPEIEARDPGAPSPLGAPPATGPDPGDTGLVRCGLLDGALMAELTAVLADRGTAVSGPAGEVPRDGIPQPCPDGSRAGAVPVAGGTLYVVLVAQADQLEPMQLATPADGGRGYALTLDDGRGLTVVSVPGAPGQPAPLADDVPELATELAGRLSGTR